MRARNIKPGFFMNDEIGELDSSCRLLFIGLWCMADREGFLKYRPKRIWAEIFPYNQTFITKVVPWLCILEKSNLIKLWYKNNDSKPLTPKHDLAEKGQPRKSEDENLGKPVFIEVVNFTKHQKPHTREKQSEIKPLIPKHDLAEKRRPERGKRNEDRGLITGRSSEQPSSNQDEKEKPLLSILLNKKNTQFQVFEEDIAQWQETFPGVDVRIEIKRCRQWSIDNPKKRKTQAGIRNHISAWLGREQNKAKGPGGGARDKPDCEVCQYNKPGPCANLKKPGFDKTKCKGFIRVLA